MSKKLYEETDIQNIADAIREKTGTEDQFLVADMGDAIRDLKVGDVGSIACVPSSWKTKHGTMDYLIYTYTTHIKLYICDGSGYTSGYLKTATWSDGVVKNNLSAVSGGKYMEIERDVEANKLYTLSLSPQDMYYLSSSMSSIIVGGCIIGSGFINNIVALDHFVELISDVYNSRNSKVVTIAGYREIAYLNTSNVPTEVTSYPTPTRYLIITDPNGDDTRLATFGGNKDNFKGDVFIKDSVVNKYKTATNWATIADRIHPLSEFDKWIDL